MPASIQEVTESLAFVCFNRVLSGYGSVALAAIGIAVRASDLAFMPIIGVSHALLPVVGFNFGAGNERRLWSAVRLACAGIMIAMGILTVIYEVFAPQIVGLFSHDSEVIAAAVPALRIGMASIALIGPNVMFVATFQGLSRGKTALLLALTRQFLVFVPLVYLFNHLWGLTGAWVAMPASDTLGFIISFAFIYRVYSRRRGAGGQVALETGTAPRPVRKA
jgi:Na+-driven multidrug efflux pump